MARTVMFCSDSVNPRLRDPSQIQTLGVLMPASRPHRQPSVSPYLPVSSLPMAPDRMALSLVVKILAHQADRFQVHRFMLRIPLLLRPQMEEERSRSLRDQDQERFSLSMLSRHRSLWPSRLPIRIPPS